jgi:hypothetical protein
MYPPLILIVLEMPRRLKHGFEKTICHWCPMTFSMLTLSLDIDFAFFLKA